MNNVLARFIFGTRTWRILSHVVVRSKQCILREGKFNYSQPFNWCSFDDVIMSPNKLSPARRQAITRSDVDPLWDEPTGANINEIKTFSSDNMYLIIPSAIIAHFAGSHYINTLWPSDTIWRYLSGSTLDQLMACRLTAPSPYLNQCWLFISEVLYPRYYSV